MTNFETQNTEWNMVESEAERIYAETAQGEQSIAVQSDMKQWALKEGHWPQMDYIHMVAAHADARGWTQEGFTGMEVYDGSL
jgi:hypothetical protein